jgi:hypothetical protein
MESFENKRKWNDEYGNSYSNFYDGNDAPFEQMNEYDEEVVYKDNTITESEWKDLHQNNISELEMHIADGENRVDLICRLSGLMSRIKRIKPVVSDNQSYDGIFDRPLSYIGFMESDLMVVTTCPTFKMCVDDTSIRANARRRFKRSKFGPMDDELEEIEWNLEKRIEESQHYSVFMFLEEKIGSKFNISYYSPLFHSPTEKNLFNTNQDQFSDFGYYMKRRIDIASPKILLIMGHQLAEIVGACTGLLEPDNQIPWSKKSEEMIKKAKVIMPFLKEIHIIDRINDVYQMILTAKKFMFYDVFVTNETETFTNTKRKWTSFSSILEDISYSLKKYNETFHERSLRVSIEQTQKPKKVKKKNTVKKSKITAKMTQTTRNWKKIDKHFTELDTEGKKVVTKSITETKVYAPKEEHETEKEPEVIIEDLDIDEFNQLFKSDD